MNINSLKSEFASYLLKLGKITQAEFENVEDINIFEYANDYKKFLSTKDDIDVNRMGMSIETLVNSISDQEGDILDALQNAKNDFENEEAGDVIDMLGLLFEEEDVKASVDANSDDMIDKSELVTFLSSISKEDKDSKDITIRDILEGSKDIKSGHYEMPKVKDWEEISSKYIKETKESDESSSAGGASGGGGVGGTGGGTGGSPNSPATTETPVDPIKEAQGNYEGLSVNELETKKTEQEGEYTKNNEALQAAIQGNSEATAALKTEMDNAYNTFLDACEGEKELTEQATQQRTALEQTQNEANQTYAERADTELQKQGTDMQITSVTASIDNISASISSLESQLSAAKSADSAEESNSSDKGKLQAQVAAIQAQIDQLNQQKTELETQKAELEEQSEKLYEKITELTTKYTDLTEKFQEQSKALEDTEKALVASSDVAAQAYVDYGAKKAEYETKYDETLVTTLSNVQVNRANIEAIENQLIIAKDKESQEQASQFSTDFEAGNYDTYVAGTDLSSYATKEKPEEVASEDGKDEKDENDEKDKKDEDKVK